MKEAKDKSDLGFMGDLLTGLSFFFNPIVAASIMGTKSTLEGLKTKSALKDMKDDFSDKYKKTFLQDEAYEAEERIKDMQVSDFDILKNALSSSIEGYTSSAGFDSANLRKSIVEGTKDPGKEFFGNNLKNHLIQKSF